MAIMNYMYGREIALNILYAKCGKVTTAILAREFTRALTRKLVQDLLNQYDTGERSISKRVQDEILKLEGLNVRQDR